MRGTSTATAPISPMPTVADAIAHTLEWLDRQSGAPRQGERRADARSRYRVQAQISYMPAGCNRMRTEQVVTRNLSRNGMSFLHRSLIYPRQAMEIHLPLPDRSIRQLTGQVVRVQPAGQDLYEIGIGFTEMEVAVA